MKKKQNLSLFRPWKIENIDFFIHTAAAVVLGGREGGFFTTVLTKPCFDGTSEQKSQNFV